MKNDTLSFTPPPHSPSQKMWVRKRGTTARKVLSTWKAIKTKNLGIRQDLLLLYKGGYRHAKWGCVSACIIFVCVVWKIVNDFGRPKTANHEKFKTVGCSFPRATSVPRGRFQFLLWFFFWVQVRMRTSGSCNLQLSGNLWERHLLHIKKRIKVNLKKKLIDAAYHSFQ